MTRVVSFNINGVRARPHQLEALRDKYDPDIIGLQETKVQDADFPRQMIEDLGYHVAFYGQKSHYGVALLSKEAPQHVEYGLPDEPKDESRLIKAEIAGLTIVNTYVPQGHSPDSEKFQYKLQWFARLLDYFQRNFTPEDALVWVGDLNIAPTPDDVYDPKTLLGHVCFHPAVHEALSSVMAWGFVDVFRKHCGQPGEYTFFDYRMPNAFGRNLGWRLDHIMATNSLAEKSASCTIAKDLRCAERPSDHVPIVAEFNWS